MKIDYFFVYETINLINGMKYRGIHKTNKINDNYLGSGTTLVNAIKKHGKENFKRKILEYCESYEKLLEREKFYVDEKWVKDRSNYNTKTGGQSAGILSEDSKLKISNTLKEKYKNGEITAAIGQWNKENGSWCKGLKMSEEFKEKCSKSGKKRYEEDNNHPLKIYGNKIVSEEQKKKTSETLKEMYKTGERVAKHELLSEEHKNKISESLFFYYKNNEHHSKGKPSWNKGISSKKLECPYCGKFVDKANGNRWHFDNCKFKSL